MRRKNGGGPLDRTATRNPHHPDQVEAQSSRLTDNRRCPQQRATSSQQVSFWDVVEHAAQILEEAGDWPTVGTPAWVELADDDPAKRAAVYDAARHWALRLETSQAAECEASSEVSGAADWRAIAQHIRDRNEYLTEKPWLRRRPA